MGHRITDDIRGEFSRSKTPVVLAGSIDQTNKLVALILITQKQRKMQQRL